MTPPTWGKSETLEASLRKTDENREQKLSLIKNSANKSIEHLKGRINQLELSALQVELKATNGGKCLQCGRWCASSNTRVPASSHGLNYILMIWCQRAMIPSIGSCRQVRECTGAMFAWIDQVPMFRSALSVYRSRQSGLPFNAHTLNFHLKSQQLTRPAVERGTIVTFTETAQKSKTGLPIPLSEYLTVFEALQDIQMTVPLLPNINPSCFAILGTNSDSDTGKGRTGLSITINEVSFATRGKSYVKPRKGTQPSRRDTARPRGIIRGAPTRRVEYC
ncbi:hypothetical protein B0H13DRAFT_1855598 [Mycena leptocephala]|nr:hypothetical protein B0H13DRAFT_1855598 [Mycena leptocephala]